MVGTVHKKRGGCRWFYLPTGVGQSNESPARNRKLEIAKQAEQVPNGTRNIKHASDITTGCVGYNTMTDAMQVSPCAAVDGTDWTNRTARSCQFFFTSIDSGGTIVAGPRCPNNEVIWFADGDGFWAWLLVMVTVASADGDGFW